MRHLRRWRHFHKNLHSEKLFLKHSQDSGHKIFADTLPRYQNILLLWLKVLSGNKV